MTALDIDMPEEEFKKLPLAKKMEIIKLRNARNAAKVAAMPAPNQTTAKVLPNVSSPAELSASAPQVPQKSALPEHVQKILEASRNKTQAQGTAISQLIPASTIAAAQVADRSNQSQTPQPLPKFTFGQEVDEIGTLDKEKFLNNLNALNSALEANAPGISGYLEAINKDLNLYPELAHKLTPDKLKVIFSGILKFNGAQLAPSIAKKKGPITEADAAALF